MRTGRACQVSPIARQQAQLYGFGHFGLTGSESGAVKGASAGASVGSVVPVIGTAIGAIAGAIGGAIAGSLNKKDPEQYNFDAAVQLWQQNRLAVLNLANKYLPLAGLFDLNLKGPHIPIYLKYGRMGEERFAHDLALLVYQAAQNGQITPQDTPQTVMVKVVQPWIDSWGFGAMNDPHQDLINLLIMGMIADYVDGSAPNVWRAVGGDLPRSFSSIPPFSLPGGTTTAPAAQYAAGTAVAAAPLSAITTPTGTAQSATAQATPITSVSQAGQSISPGQSLPFGGGTFSFGSNSDGQGNSNVLFNGQDTATLAFAGNPMGPVSRGVRLQVASNGALILVQASGTAYGWTNAGWQYLGSGSNLPTPAPAQPATTAAVSTTVAVPAGFSLVGAANGLQAYLGPDGNYYSWSGTAMAPLTGMLMGTSGQSANVVNGQIVPTAAQPALNLNTQGIYSVPQYTNPSAPTTTPVSAPVAAAGIGAGLSGWVGYAALGVLGFMVWSATRHSPAQGKRA